jgi:glycosyltransferase involved in cell wall biosynthesis
MQSLSVIVPFFNESRFLSRLVNELDALPENTVAEVIFIDDGSTDDSVSILKESLRSSKLKSSIHSKQNGGKASAVELGAKFLKTSHVLILDADLELSTSDIAKLWSVITTNQSEVVFGYRNFLAQSSFTWRYAKGNRLISNLYGVLFNELITDIMCGYKLMPSQILQSIPFKAKGFAIEVEIPIQLWKYRIRPYEVSVDYFPRSRSEGKGITVFDAVKIIFTLVTQRIFYSRQRGRT